MRSSPANDITQEQYNAILSQARSRHFQQLLGQYKQRVFETIVTPALTKNSTRRQR